MSRRLSVPIWCFALALMIAAVPGAAMVSVVTEPQQIILRVTLPPNAEFRVWHTANPMKVIVDLDVSLPDPPLPVPAGDPTGQPTGALGFSDVALSQLRWADRPDGPGTRLVLDFKYQLPEPRWSVEGQTLVVVVDKVFNWSSVANVSYGVYYGHQRRGSEAGPLIVNYLDIRISDPGIEFKSVLGQERVFGAEYVSSMAVRSQAIAAVNGAYFAADGRPLGVLAIGGELVSEPYASRTAVGLGRNFAVIGSLDAVGFVETQYGSAPLTGMNRPRLEHDLILYTPYYGDETRTNVFGLDVLIRDNRVIAIRAGGMAIPDDAVVISGHGRSRDFLADLEVGDFVHWEMKLEPDWLAEGITEIIGGGPRLLRDGEVFITGEAERFRPDITQGRAPRTALGLTADGRLLVVTVNGRSPNVSVGMTLSELALLLLELGAVDAMNLDGGGSTTMVIRNRVLNIPSDGRERPVSNALIISTPESRR